MSLAKASRWLLCPEFLGRAPRQGRNPLHRNTFHDARREEARIVERAKIAASGGVGRGPVPEDHALRKDSSRGRGGSRPFRGGRGNGSGWSGQARRNEAPNMWPCSCGKQNYANRSSCYSCNAARQR